MKKRIVSRFFVFAYILAPAAAVGVQAYLTDRVVTVRQTIERQYAITEPAPLVQVCAKPATREKVWL